jgi:Tol biopolymer transport system component
LKQSAISNYKFLLFTAMLLPSLVWAQGMYTPFGQNRVQYKNTRFVWSFVKAENFDAYFYPGGRELATFAARVAEEQLNGIEKVIDHRLSNRIEIICYNTQQEYKQANFGLSDQPANLGGITQVSSNRIFIYFNGNRGDFEKRLRENLSLVLINELLFGGTVTERLQNAALLNLPDWYLFGLTTYIGEPWNVNDDNKLKDLFNSGRGVKKFNRLLYKEPILAGRSFWRFLVEKYGVEVIANMLYITRLSRNYETALVYVTGIDLKQASKEWLQYYKDQYGKEDNLRSIPATELKVKKRFTPYLEAKLKVAPKGDYVAYTTNKSGKYKVWTINTKTGKNKKIHKGGLKYYQREIDHSFPMMAWHPGGEKLSYVYEKSGKIYIKTVDLITKKKTKILFLKFDKITSFSYSENGTQLIISAIRKGQSDLYIYDMQSRRERQITNDPFDDLYPVYADGGSKILFASNRNSDSLGAAAPMTLNPDNNLDIYVYDLERTGQPNALKRLSNTPSINETNPVEYSNNYYSYLTEYNGIINRYAVRVEEQYDFSELQVFRKDSLRTIDTLYFEQLEDRGSVFTYRGRIIRLGEDVEKIDTIIHTKDVVFTYPLTNYSRSILAQDICRQTQKAYDLVLNNKRYYILESPLDKQVEEKGRTTETYPNMFRLKTGYATRPFVIGEAVFKPRPVFAAAPVENKETPEPKKQDSIMPDEFFFINEFTPNNFKPEDVKPEVKVLPKPEEKILKVSAPKFYNVTFFADKLVTQLDNSVINTYYQPITPSGENLFNPGLNGMFKYGLLDLFEDYRLTGGFRVPFDLSGFDYFLTYEALKKRLDHRVTFYRQSRNGFAEGTSVKSTVHEIRYEARYPINQVLSLRGNIFGRMDRDVFKGIGTQSFAREDNLVYWMGYKGELVFDNTIPKGLNLYDGTRFKLFYEQYINFENRDVRLNAAGFDYRYYEPIHRNIIFCTRFTANTSWGRSKVRYVMGGVDNWIAPQYDASNNTVNSENYAFQALATNMRGFKQNIRNGSTFAAASVEIRIPIVSYIANRPIRSDFLNNLLILPFFDVGTAWTGKGPYSDENTFNQKVYQVSFLKATVINVREPLVAGFGPGIRSKLLGYYIRFDTGWGIQDGEVAKKPIYHVSLSMDF